MPRRLSIATLLTALIAIIALMATANAPAQQPSPTETRAAIEAIENQIAELQAQHRALQASLTDEPAQPATDATALLKPAGTKSKPSARQSRGPRRVASVIELIKRLPEAIRAGDDGTWPLAAEADAIDHLRFAIWDTPYVNKLVVKAVRVQPNPSLKRDPLASPFQVAISFEPLDHDFRGHKLRESFQPLVLYTDAREKQRIETLKPGRAYEVRAKLKTINGLNNTVLKLAPTVLPTSLVVHFRSVAIPGVFTAD